MSLLSVPFYNQNQEDLQKFLILGMTFGLDLLTKCYPTYKNSSLWMTGHILNLRTHLPCFTEYEKTAIRRLHAALDSQNNTPSSLLFIAPNNMGHPSFNTVIPDSSLPTSHNTPPLQIPSQPLSQQIAYSGIVSDYSKFGGGILLKARMRILLFILLLWNL